jgi:signal transduction histidine kinase
VAARAELEDLVGGRVPVMLAERGLGAALTTLAATTPMAVDIDVRYPAGLPVEAALTTWYAVSESVANAVKYADATLLNVRGFVHDGRVVAVVTDDGRGGADPTKGTGLTNLRQRLTHAGGQLLIRTAPGAGTEVRVEVPVGERP